MALDRETLRQGLEQALATRQRMTDARRAAALASITTVLDGINARLNVHDLTHMIATTQQFRIDLTRFEVETIMAASDSPNEASPFMFESILWDVTADHELGESLAALDDTGYNVFIMRTADTGIIEITVP